MYFHDVFALDNCVSLVTVRISPVNITLCILHNTACYCNLELSLQRSTVYIATLGKEIVNMNEL